MQTVDGSTFEKTATGSRSIAEAVFKAFFERDELEDKPVSVDLMHMRSTLVVHRFDKPAGGADNWQGREDEIPWPEGTGQVGRPAKLEGSSRVNLYLDDASKGKAKKLGKGNFSLSVRIALSRA